MAAERPPEKSGRRQRADRLERVCYEAMNHPPGDRAEYVERTCGDDRELRREVESLLAADARAAGFLERPLLADRALRLEAGARVGPYELMRKLGEGGMSTVYLAVRSDDQYRKRVALKIVGHGLATDDRLRRFRAERQILAGLEHPNIARLLDGGATENGLPYFVMELVEGDPIDVYCDRHRLPIDQRLRLFRAVCAAVHYAHRNLVVHRDLKPSNVLVTADGVPKLLDFGIAKLLNPDLALPDPHPTDTWLRAMTPEFASPEQLLGGNVTTASDVYALGVVLYMLLTGRLPRTFADRTAVPARPAAEVEIERPSAAVLGPRRGGEDPAAIARARRTTPRQLARRLRRDLDFVVLTALRNEPDRRYGSAEQLADDLERYEAGLPVTAREGELGYRARKFLRRHRLAAAAGAGFLAAMLAFTAVLLQQARHTALERDRAEETVRFVERMLSVADPAQGAGEAGTLRAALDRGLEQLGELADQPLLRARLQSLLATIYGNLGEYETADTLLRSALATRRDLLGEDREVVDTLNALGHVALARGNYAEAGTLLAEATNLGRRLLGPAHPSIADGLVGLGWARELQGDLVEAERHQREALAMRRELLGDRHVSVADSLRALAGLRWQLGEAADGEDLFRRALALLEAELGPDHPEVGSVLNDLGALLHERGALEEAGALLRRSIDLKRARLGGKHPMVLTTENHLADLLREEGDLDGAEALARRVLAARAETLGEDHPHTVRSRLTVAKVLAARGEPLEARALLRTALEQAMETFGPTHPTTAEILAHLGRSDLATGDSENAEENLREALAVHARILPADHWRTAQSRSLLGEALAAQSRFAEAEELLLDALEALRRARGPDAPETREAHRRVVDLYLRWGKDAEAERFRRNPRPH